MFGASEFRSECLIRGDLAERNDETHAAGRGYPGSGNMHER